MNNGFVVDSSVAISWVTPSQASFTTDQLLERVTAGTPFVVPLLWSFEVANTLMILKRRKRIATEEWDNARATLSRLTPIVDEEGPKLALIKISKLADNPSSSVYDAAYLELALRRGLPLATRDGALFMQSQLLFCQRSISKAMV